MKRSATAVIFGLLFLLFILLLTPKIAHIVKLKSQKSNLDTELVQLRKENLRLENELRSLREDPVYLERVAREKLNKAKQGEIVYQLVDKNGEPVRRKKD